MCNGDLPPPSFNDLLDVFLPEGSADENIANNAKRITDNTRPLSFNSTDADNETGTAVANKVITPTTAANADRPQNGFVIGRQGIDNVITLDTQAHVQDHIAEAVESPRV